MCLSPDIAGKYVRCPNLVNPVYLSPDRDQGYDVAIVKYDRALIRTTPKYSDAPGTRCYAMANTGNEVPCDGEFLYEDDFLVLLSRNPAGDWYNVVKVETGREGWVYKSHVDLLFTRNPRKQSGIFQAAPGESYSNPELQITNGSGRSMTLRVGTRSYTFVPNQTSTIVLEPGQYSYFAFAPGVLPVIGEQEFTRGRIYYWRFYIKTVVR